MHTSYLCTCNRKPSVHKHVHIWFVFLTTQIWCIFSMEKSYWDSSKLLSFSFIRMSFPFFLCTNILWSLVFIPSVHHSKSCRPSLWEEEVVNGFFKKRKHWLTKSFPRCWNKLSIIPPLPTLSFGIGIGTVSSNG